MALLLREWTRRTLGNGGAKIQRVQVVARRVAGEGRQFTRHPCALELRLNLNHVKYVLFFFLTVVMNDETTTTTDEYEAASLYVRHDEFVIDDAPGYRRSGTGPGRGRPFTPLHPATVKLSLVRVSFKPLITTDVSDRIDHVYTSAAALSASSIPVERILVSKRYE